MNNLKLYYRVVVATGDYEIVESFTTKSKALALAKQYKYNRIYPTSYVSATFGVMSINKEISFDGWLNTDGTIQDLNGWKYSIINGWCRV